MSTAVKALILTWVAIGFLVVGVLGFYLGRITAPRIQPGAGMMPGGMMQQWGGQEGQKQMMPGQQQGGTGMMPGGGKQMPPEGGFQQPTQGTGQQGFQQPPLQR